MTKALHIPAQGFLLGQFLQLLRSATQERMVMLDLEGIEIDQRILLESHLVRLPTVSHASQKAPYL